VSDLADNRRGIDGDNDAVGLARARGRPNRASRQALNVQPVLQEVPTVVEGDAFTTGAVPRTSIEHVLPDTWVE
jgi:hypothetical protein